eukprot:1313288-Pleurochrysis_carterae.AAC.1
MRSNPRGRRMQRSTLYLVGARGGDSVADESAAAAGLVARAWLGAADVGHARPGASACAEATQQSQGRTGVESRGAAEGLERESFALLAGVTFRHPSDCTTRLGSAIPLLAALFVKAHLISCQRKGAESLPAGARGKGAQNALTEVD